ncbi:response regulator transcription factor [Paenibacillus prosopidis]|uniref:Two-component system response regulator VicR n=1 Tax=Paenibacillus prosopidis TaxID=630520 RepID=A0A368W277_9BACL|nr:response regulator transcription factor [Paenibacillus prosopidis]RCW47925.1 two-component system response regulator VicR [Paenibacillus prosopidis]
MPGELILTVDDEVRIGELVGMYLSKDGFRHLSATSGKQAIELAENEQPSLIVLDVLLPDMEGYELCARLRQKTDVPIVFLTCKDTEIDKVVGLSVGADDYVSKPFSPVELVARIKAQLRRNRIVRSRQVEENSVIISSEHVQLRIDAHEVYVDGTRIELSVKEFQLLAYLMQNARQVLTTERLLSHIWGYESSLDTKTLQVHIGHLRKKIEQNPAAPSRIITIRGIGYKFDEPIKDL